MQNFYIIADSKDGAKRAAVLLARNDMRGRHSAQEAREDLKKYPAALQSQCDAYHVTIAGSGSREETTCKIIT